MKKRILWVNEASFMNTGFSVQSMECLKRLYALDRYEIHELGSYSPQDDPRANSLPWKFYSAIPDQRDKIGTQRYANSMDGQFGSAVYEDVLLDCKPDIVIHARDPWMSNFEIKSPFRKYYKSIWIPTIDGSPQKIEWLDDYRTPDLLMTHSKFAKKLLEREASDIKVFDLANPGVDHEMYKPLDQKECRKSLGLPENANIILTVMRNQKRKLFPDLLEMFSEFLNYCISKGNTELAKNTYLYLHTSYPDVGYDISRLILQNKLCSKVFVTYWCRNCRNYYADFFQSELTICKHCAEMSAYMPNTQHGLTREQLVPVYSSADLYIQYSTCLAKDEKILLDSGWTNIQDVKVGDKAFTHKHRYMPVVDAFESDYQNNMVEVSVHSDFEKVKMTKNHKALVYRKEDIDPNSKTSLRDYLGTLIREDCKFPEPTWNEINDCKSGDILVYPIDDFVEDVDIIDLADFVPEDEEWDIQEDTIKVKNGNKHLYPRFIKIDDEFCTFMGLFVANGSWSSSNNTIKITCNLKENENIKLAQDVLRKISDKKPSVRNYKGGSAVDVYCCSHVLVEFFKLFSKHEFKQLPKFVNKLPPSKQKEIIVGMFMGDRCIYNKHEQSCVSIYNTMSYDLQCQLKNVLNRLRIQYNCCIQKKSGGKRKNQFRLEIFGEIKNRIFHENTTSSSENVYRNNNRLIQIKKIKDIEYNEQKVYCVEVENDHSLVTKLGAKNNSEGLSMPQTEAKCCGVPVFAVDHSAMSEHVECLGTTKIEVKRGFHETCTETEQFRALPDNEDCVKKLYTFFGKSKKERDSYGPILRQDAIDNFSFDRAAKIIEKAIDSLEVLDRSKTWDNEEKHLKPTQFDVPENLNNGDFIDWLIINVSQEPKKVDSEWRNMLVKSLNIGYLNEKGGREDFNREIAQQMFAYFSRGNNYWETVRVHKLNPNKPKSLEWENI